MLTVRGTPSLGILAVAGLLLAFPARAQFIHNPSVVVKIPCRATADGQLVLDHQYFPPGFEIGAGDMHTQILADAPASNDPSTRVCTVRFGT